MSANRILRKLLQRIVKAGLIFLTVLFLLHIVLYFVSNYSIQKIETHKLEDFLTEIPGKWINVNGDRVHFIEKGKGNPVIFLHGFAGSTYDWEQTIFSDLPENRRSICIDLSGMGFSERRENWHYDFPLWAEQLNNTMNQMGISKASVVGFSLGGSVAAVFAARYPEKVDRLVLISSLSPMDIDNVPFRSMIYYIPGGGEIMLTIPLVIGSYFFQENQQYKRYRQTSSIIGTRQALLTFMHEVPDFPGLFASYPRIRSKTLLIHGEQDSVVPLSSIKRIVPEIPDCRVIFLKNAGHWVIREDRKRVVDELGAFLY